MYADMSCLRLALYALHLTCGRKTGFQGIFLLMLQSSHMTDSTLMELTKSVMRHFQAKAAGYGLNARGLTVRYLLNWGGFVNASFHISDGQTAFHLKLTDDEDSRLRLERWLALRELLTERYRAPRVREWVELEDSKFGGLLFEHLAGRPADFRAEPALHAQVLALAARLHADPDLAAELGEGQPPITCSDSFIETYIDRFDEDLLVIARDLPPFVALPTLDWMQGETRQLEAQARELDAFQQPARSPIHGDLWEQNVLVAEDGAWFVLDWDDLDLGDPALEYGILLGPLLAHLPPAQRPTPAALPADPALHERFAVYLRAYLLDEVIDSLADYVESDFAPEQQAEVQAEKQRQHEQALRLYQNLYPE